MSTTKTFISMYGEERTFEEQIIYLSQTIRSLSLTISDNEKMIDDLHARVCYLETQV